MLLPTHRPLSHHAILTNQTFASRHPHEPNFCILATHIGQIIALQHPPPHSSTMTNAFVIGVMICIAVLPQLCSACLSLFHDLHCCHKSELWMLLLIATPRRSGVHTN
jgi:hypothetical protein